MTGSQKASAEELLSLLEEFEKSGRSLDDIPKDLADLLRNVKKGKGQPTEDFETEEITPEPGFVVKTADETGRKAFLNICGHSKVPAPGNWVGGIVPDAVAEALENLDNLDDKQMDTLRFPLSMGPLKPDLDAKGDPCTTTDCVLALEVVRAAAGSRRLKAFLIELAMSWVSSKYKMVLDPKYKLPKMRYKGETIEMQRIRLDRKPLVTELADVAEEPAFPLLTKRPPPGKVPAPVPGPPPAAGAAAAAGTARQLIQEADVGISAAAGGGAQKLGPREGAQALGQLSCSVEYEGRPVEAVTLLVLLPGGRQVAAADVQVEVHLPLAVSADGARAELEGGSLRLRLPYRPLDDMVAEARRAAPLPLGAIKLSNQSYLELEP